MHRDLRPAARSCRRSGHAVVVLVNQDEAIVPVIRRSEELLTG